MIKRSLDTATWRLISSCLDRLLDLLPRQREVALAEIRATHPDITAQVRELLAEHDVLKDREFLQQPPDDLLEILSQQLRPLKGRRIGPYTLEHILGRGGMGEVWLASRSDGRFDSHYAIKFLDGSEFHGSLAERFHREGRVLGRLAHPNIARLIDAGTIEESRPYLVLEYVEGQRIDQYCQEHELSIAARVQLFLDVVSAVAHAHANLVIHRDLKPSNVLVTAAGTVKLLDFGIAKLVGTDLDDVDASVTRREDAALTPEYAAPEQLLGETPSTATDVYQLGMLLYVLLTGRHPLPAASTRSERIRIALEGRPPRASEFVTGPARNQLRGDLDAILSMALRREPQERYSTAAALRDDLLRYLSREPVRAQRGAALYRARKFVMRNRLTVTVATFALSGLLAALIFAFQQATIAAAERDHAVALASRNAAVSKFMGIVLTEAAESDKPTTVNDMLARGEKLALADTSGNVENRAAVLAMIAERHEALNENGKAAQLLEDALALLRDSRDEALRSKLTCEHALSIVNGGQSKRAKAIIERELKHLPADTDAAAHCLLTRALIARDAETAESAVRYATNALTLFRSSPQARAGDDEGRYLNVLAITHRAAGKTADADRYYQLALKSYVDAGRGRSPEALSIRNNWAVLFSAAGVPRRALDLYQEISLIAAERTPDGRPPVFMMANRASALETLGRFDEAQAVALAAVNLGDQRHMLFERAASLFTLAGIAMQRQQSALAEDYANRLAALLDPAMPPDSPPLMALAVLRGELALAADQPQLARSHFTRALGKTSGKNTLTNAHLGLAEVELHAGNAAAAVKEARLALDIATTMQGDLPHSCVTGRAWLMLGRAYRQLGDETNAHHAFATAVNQISNTVDAGHPVLIEARQRLDQQ